MNVGANTNPGIDITGISNASGIKNVVDRATVRQNHNKDAANAAELTKNDVKQMVEALEDFSETLQTKLNFSVHEQTNAIVVKVIDRNTDEIIRQIPPEEMLELHEKMKDLTGFLLNENV